MLTNSKYSGIWMNYTVYGKRISQRHDVIQDAIDSVRKNVALNIRKFLLQNKCQSLEQYRRLHDDKKPKQRELNWSVIAAEAVDQLVE